MNNDMAIVCADRLMDFCESQGKCSNKCPFYKEMFYSDYNCLINAPSSWNILELTQKIRKQIIAEGQKEQKAE